jgi:hypothetical protein
MLQAGQALPRNEAERNVEPLATYTGSLQCFNNFDFREEGGAPGRLVVWPGRLEMSGLGILKAMFRPRTIPKERIQLIRPLLPTIPAPRKVIGAHPFAPGLPFINLVVSPPKEQRINTGNIHYILGIHSADPADVLALLDSVGFPVSRTPIRINWFNMLGALSELDLADRPGHSGDAG